MTGTDKPITFTVPAIRQGEPAEIGGMIMYQVEMDFRYGLALNALMQSWKECTMNDDTLMTDRTLIVQEHRKRTPDEPNKIDYVFISDQTRKIQPSGTDPWNDSRFELKNTVFDKWFNLTDGRYGHGLWARETGVNDFLRTVQKLLNFWFSYPEKKDPRIVVEYNPRMHETMRVTIMFTRA